MTTVEMMRELYQRMDDEIERHKYDPYLSIMDYHEKLNLWQMLRLTLEDYEVFWAEVENK